MTIVNINDIEDLVLAKHEIDLIMNELGELDGRSNLNEFIKNYGSPTYVYLINDIQIAFNYFKKKDKDFLFVVNNNEDEINIIKTKLKFLKYDLNNLVEIPRIELATKIDMNNVVIYNGKYYM